MFRKIKRYIYEFTHPVIGEVWLLHSITNTFSNDLKIRECEVSPQKLESIILSYLQNDYDFITMDEIGDYVTQGIYKRKNRFVAITLDDGYANNYHIALPIFIKYNVPFCIYTSKDFLLHNGFTSPYNTSAMMDLFMLKDISKNKLCTIGAHSVSHPHLSKFNYSHQYKEINDSKLFLEDIIGKPVVHFAYPYGDFNNYSLRILDELGFSTSVLAWGGGIRKSFSERYKIPRKIIYDRAGT